MHTGPDSAIILDTVVKATVLLVLAWVAALVLKRRSAATQHMVRAFSLAALLLLPFSVIFLPAWRVNGIPSFGMPPATAQTPGISPRAAAPAAQRNQATLATPTQAAATLGYA